MRIFSYTCIELIICLRVCVSACCQYWTSDWQNPVPEGMGNLPWISARLLFRQILLSTGFLYFWKNGISATMCSWLHHLWVRQYSKAQTHKIFIAHRSACLYSKACLSWLQIKQKQAVKSSPFFPKGQKVTSGYCSCSELKLRIN